MITTELGQEKTNSFSHANMYQHVHMYMAVTLHYIYIHSQSRHKMLIYCIYFVFEPSGSDVVNYINGLAHCCTSQGICY